MMVCINEKDEKFDEAYGDEDADGAEMGTEKGATDGDGRKWRLKHT